MEVCGQRHAPAALPPANAQYPLYRRLGGPQGRHEDESRRNQTFLVYWHHSLWMSAHFS